MDCRQNTLAMCLNRSFGNIIWMIKFFGKTFLKIRMGWKMWHFFTVFWLISMKKWIFFRIFKMKWKFWSQIWGGVMRTVRPRWTHVEPTVNPRWTHVEPTLNPRRDGSRPTVCDVKPNYSYFKLFFWKSGCPKFFYDKFQMNEPASYGWIVDYRFLRSFWDFSFDLFNMIPESRLAHGHPTANFLSCVLRTVEWVILKIWLPWVVLI